MRRHCNSLSKIPKAACDIDSCSDLAYKPKSPLPAKSFCMYIVGSPGSGKTNLWQSLLLSKDPKYYTKFFDLVHLISGSLATLPKKVIKALPDERTSNQFSDELLTEIVQKLQSGPNTNNLIILDDVIKDLKRSKILSKVFLNRRHCTHDENQDKNGGLSIIVTSQKYTLLPLEQRTACSHAILFKSANRQEIDRIREEIMFDLEPAQQDTLLKEAWREPYSFLFIAINAPRDQKYFIKFDRVEI